MTFLVSQGCLDFVQQVLFLGDSPFFQICQGLGILTARVITDFSLHTAFCKVMWDFLLFCGCALSFTCFSLGISIKTNQWYKVYEPLQFPTILFPSAVLSCAFVCQNVNTTSTVLKYCRYFQTGQQMRTQNYF